MVNPKIAKKDIQSTKNFAMFHNHLPQFNYHSLTQKFTCTCMLIIVAVVFADYVRPLKKPVRARYCKGLFTQVPFRDGSVYNVSTN